MIDRANAFLHRYAVLLLLVFFVFALFDLLYVGPLGREIRQRESLLEAAQEKLDGLNKEVARLKGFERAAELSLRTLLQDTAGYANATAETALLHLLNERADARGIATGPFTVRRAQLPDLGASEVACDFEWSAPAPALDAFLDDLAAAEIFACVDGFSASFPAQGPCRGAMTVALRLRAPAPEKSR